MLTVVIPSFYSSKKIEERITEIGKSVPIIIIENSKDLDFKNKIEREFENVKVIIPNENLGFGKAVNIGIKEAKTKMVFLTQPDVKLIDNCIDKLFIALSNSLYNIVTSLNFSISLKIKISSSLILSLGFVMLFVKKLLAANVS